MVPGSELVREDVDINTVRAWLGHASVDTTNIYAEINLEMKAKAGSSMRGGRTGAKPSMEGKQRTDGVSEPVMTDKLCCGKSLIPLTCQ